MALNGSSTMTTFLSYFAFSVLILLSLANPSFAQRTRRPQMNVIDGCWRTDRNWARNRQRLGMCSVGFAGKMTNNVGRGVKQYIVTDPSDEPIKPLPGTLRYGATMIRGKVWITFQRNMLIKLHKPLLISSFTTIDGRGADVQIAYGACFLINEVTNVIIHGLRFHNCQKPQPGPVIGPGAKIVDLGRLDGDAIAMVGSRKVWIDHNTLSKCQDGLIDVTRGSTDVTISNNLFTNHDKVMLLGHDDGFVLDRRMRVTVIFNRFGPNCNQRMPRVRHGYAHVVNNLYHGWGSYAIGGSMNPIIKSEANLFIAPNSNHKAVTWREGGSMSSTWRSKNDYFVNGAYFKQSGTHSNRPQYNRNQSFRIANVRDVRTLTSSSGALRCSSRSWC